METKYKALHKALSQRPYKNNIDVVELAKKINGMSDTFKANVIITVMRQDPYYSEEKFEQDERGIKFDILKLSSIQVHILNELINSLI
jgi:hypothetical protein